MKLEIAEDRTLTLGEVYDGIGIETETGTYWIAERDGGLEIVKDGVLVFSDYMVKYLLSVLSRCDTTEAQRMTKLYSETREVL